MQKLLNDVAMLAATEISIELKREHAQKRSIFQDMNKRIKSKNWRWKIKKIAGSQV